MVDKSTIDIFSINLEESEFHLLFLFFVILLEWTFSITLGIYLVHIEPDTIKWNLSKETHKSFVPNIFSLRSKEIQENSLIFHAGTLKKGNNIYAIGGRVLNFVSHAYADLN